MIDRELIEVTLKNAAFVLVVWVAALVAMLSQHGAWCALALMLASDIDPIHSDRYTKTAVFCIAACIAHIQHQ